MGACASRLGRDNVAEGLSIDQRNLLLKEFREISSEMEVAPLMGRTIQAILSVLPVERASVFLVDKSSGVMRTFNTMDMRSSVPASGAEARKSTMAAAVTIPIDSGVAGAVVQSNLLIVNFLVGA